MKNIHLLSTDNHSRLYVVNSTGKLHWSEGYLPQIDGGRNKHIYITSDEEIKEGDWYITTLDNEIYKANSSTIIIMNDANKFPHTTYRNTHFKIVLTDNKDLIKDGVQAIDDEFLKWFVKNPSCEWVEVISNSDYEMLYKVGASRYKIIIPKEESKSLIEKMKPAQEQWQRDMLKTLEESKQETLEEAAMKMYPIKTDPSGYDINMFSRYGFYNGAKWQVEKTTITTDDAYSEGFENGKNWQKERLYTEEEVKEILFHRETHYMKTAHHLHINEWFEQFKKK